MTKFIFKSTAADLQKIIAITETIQKNVLYLTYQVDWIRKTIKDNVTDKGLQKQVDEYFEDDETSPQTDPEEHDSSDRD